MLFFQAWAQAFLSISPCWITWRRDWTAQAIIAPATLRCSDQIPASASVKMTFKLPSKSKVLWFHISWIQPLLLSFYAQKSRAAGRGDKVLPPQSWTGHDSQWGFICCQKQPKWATITYWGFTYANNGYLLTDNSQLPASIQQFCHASNKLHLISWVPLQQAGFWP